MNKYSIILILSLLLGNISNVLAQNINWLSIEELETAQANEARKVLIDVYTEWCGWCKKMDKTTFKDKVLVDYVKDNFYCVKFDGEDKNLINYRGYEFKYVPNGRRGYNELAYELLRGKMSYPSIVFLDENLDILQPFKGFRTAEELLPIIKYLGEDIYKNTSWTEYMNESKGKK
ncbi:MAG: thioredoxin-related protein [Flavobacteriaceae bacterium]|jgi:thioredoxin-related protein|uniref:thioredoxin family protein n=1 Tax=Candidatus Marifrigoribacter sp. Uisw_064 TaxID=3230970 RepID=UPI003AD88BD4